jgi:competence protein ComEC
MIGLSRFTGVVPLSLSMLGGAIAVACLPALLSRYSIAAVALALLVLAWRWRLCRLPAFFALGFAWATIQGSLAMDARLPDALHGKNVLVTGHVDGLPAVRPDATRFVLRIEQAELDGQPLDLRGKLRLSWHRPRLNLPACSRWQLMLRLKRPRGLINPGGIDSERVALTSRIVATGYVREDDANTMLADSGACVDGWRESLSQRIAERVADRRDAASLRAFAVGDTRGLDNHDWEIARANGIPHLIAISGFHVGVAAIGGVWLAQLLYLLWPALGLHIPAPIAKAVMALLVAAGYGVLAGLGVATVRTLLMIAVIAWARCLRRQPDAAVSLAIALIAMLLLDPLSVLTAGFWLSFVGVALLMFCLKTRQGGWRDFIRELCSAQWLMTISLLPLTMWFFGEASLVGALSNLLAIPVVSLLVVPGVLLSMVLLVLCPPLATPLLWLLAGLMHGQWWVFEQLAQLPGAHWYLPQVRPLALLCALSGAVWMFSPRGVPLRILGALLFLPLLFPSLSRPRQGAFEMWMLDVGQGLAILLRTQHRTLVYDTGAGYSADFNMGDAVVLPSMRALGWNRLDRLIVSHADNDHAGGAQAVMRAFPEAVATTGEPERLPGLARCEPGESWIWDDVRFSLIQPPSSPGSSNNDRSCVLLVEGRGGSLVIGGDISAKVEARLLDRFPLSSTTVLLAPHHGSRSSSSERFIAGVRPSLALVSAGWRSRFGHPHPLVVERYGAAGVPLLNTADTGAVRVDFPSDAEPHVAARWRQIRRPYWRE